VSRPLRLLVAALALPVGLAVGVVGTVGSRQAVRVLGTDLPVGLPLALAASFLVVVIPGALAGWRPAAAAAATGWFAAVTALLWSRPEGDVVVTGDWLGLSWLGLGVLVVAAGLVPQYSAARPSPSGDPPDGR
jgi:hypothetical protein